MSTKPRQRLVDRNPEIGKLVRELCRTMSLDAVAQVLAERGFVNRKGMPFGRSTIYRMLEP